MLKQLRHLAPASPIKLERPFFLCMVRNRQSWIAGTKKGNSRCTGKFSDNVNSDQSPCLRLSAECGLQWLSGPCGGLSSIKDPAFCQKNAQKISGNSTFRFEYNKTNLKKHITDNQHLVLHVWHKYEAASKHLLDSWKEPRMTGFRLRWSLKDEKGHEKHAPTDPKYKTGYQYSGYLSSVQKEGGDSEDYIWLRKTNFGQGKAPLTMETRCQ